jgi:O-antigen/teichoic acid export membrane protein
MFKKLFTHSFLYSVAPQIPSIASLALMPLLTKHLKLSDYGIYGIITSYLYFVIVLKDLGLGIVFVNTFFKYPKKWKIIWRLLHGHLIFWSFVFTLLFLIILYIAIPKEAMSNFNWIAAMYIFQIILFDNTNSIGNYFYRFSEKPAVIAIICIVTGFVSIFINYYCIVYLKLGYMSWFIASFASSLITFLIYIYPIYIKNKLIPIIKFRKDFIIQYLKVSLPMIPHNYSSYLLNSSDRVVLDLYKVDKDKIGYYNIAYQFANYFETFGSAIGMAVGPFYTKLYTKSTEKALQDERRLTFFLMSGFIIATFIASLWLREIFNLLISKAELRNTYDIGIIVMMGYAYRPMYWSVGIKLSTLGGTSSLWKISAIAGFINVVLNIIFVPYYGIYAAAINTFISLMYIGFSGYYLKSYRKLKNINHFPFLWLISIILISLSAFLLKDVIITVKGLITLFVLTVFGILVRKYWNELRDIEI